MAIPIIIVSHKRAGSVTTHRIVPHALVCVPCSQAGEYLKHHREETLVVHPDSVVGLCAKRQWVYEKYGDVMMIDDDCVGMSRLHRPAGHPRRANATPQRTWEIMQATAETARNIGAYLFGFNVHAHPRTYVPGRPIRLGGYSQWGFQGLLAGSKLWWPTNCTLPIDDYWICLLNMHFHRYAYYDMRFALQFRGTYTNPGGMSEFRKADSEKKATEYLVQHFGRDVVVPKTSPSNVTKRNVSAEKRKVMVPWPH